MTSNLNGFDITLPAIILEKMKDLNNPFREISKLKLKHSPLCHKVLFYLFCFEFSVSDGNLALQSVVLALKIHALAVRFTRRVSFDLKMKEQVSELRRSN